MVFALVFDRFQPALNGISLYLSFIERKCPLNFCLSYGQKVGGGTTGHAKKVVRRPNPKFDDYTQNSSEK
jgi:hypothetical protein